MAKLDEERERLSLIKEGKRVEMARREEWAQGSDGAQGVWKFNEKEVEVPLCLNMWPMQRA